MDGLEKEGWLKEERLYSFPPNAIFEMDRVSQKGVLCDKLFHRKGLHDNLGEIFSHSLLT